MGKAIFGAGCFWGVEDVFRKTKGVTSTRVGYSAGNTENPTYKQVCSGMTGHAEVVEVTYDPNIISYTTLLDLFWKMHNPTSLNRQGPDIGTQYRSIIIVNTNEQLEEAIKSKKRAQDNFQKSIVTEVVHGPVFYEAEDYHQHYHEKHGGSCRL